ncbi:DUF637 domain-containing protein [Eionea flava]
MKPLPSGEKNTMSKSLCWSTRAIAYCAMFSVFMQPLPVLSASFSDGYIQDQLNSFALFERSSTSDYQFQAVDYINEPVQAPSMDIDAFHAAMKQQYKHALEPKYVPIKVGNTHTVVPIYPETKKVGTSLLQNRYIRSQIHSLLGRSLIDAELYTNENQQIDTLYQNALNYTLNAPALRYGDRLPMSQSGSGLAQDMIWPEIREINGESVVVPVVYLSDNTVNQQKVTTNVTELNGSVSLAALRIDDVDVHLGREAFLNVANDLTNYRGSIVSSGNLTLVAGGTLRNLSGDIKANGNITIGAHSIENRTIIYRHTERNVGFSGGAHESGTRYAQIAGINAIDGSVTLNSMSNISFLGGQVSAGSELTLSADGDIYIEGLQLNNQYTEQQGGVSLSRSDTTYLQSSLSSKDTLRLIAGGEIVITASELISDEGHIQLLAELGITVLDGKQEHRQNRTGTYRSRDINESVYQTVAVRSILDAGLGVRMHSAFGDITLRGSEISSSQGASVTAENGGIKLLLTKELDHYSYSSIDKGLFTIKTENRGHEIETAVHNTIVGGLQVSATGGVYVEYEGDSELTMQEQIANIGEFEGMEWMADFYAENQYNPNIDWQEIETTYKEWNESSTSISPALAAVIAIAVAVATGGAAAGLVGSMVSNSVAAAAITAGSVSLLSQATVALANGAVNRDISGAMEDFASSDTLRSVAIAMVTAGAMDAINTQLFTADNLGASSSFTEEVTSQVTNSATGVTTTVTELNLTLGAQALQAVTSSVVNAGVRTAIDGGSLGDSLVDSLIQNSVNFIGQRMTNAISDAAANGDIDKAIEYIAHAGSGCMVGVFSAAQNDESPNSGCASGALGAVASVAITDVYEAKNKDRINTFLIEEQEYIAGLYAGGSSHAEVGSFVSGRDDHYRQGVNRLLAGGANASRLSAAFGAMLAGADAGNVNIAAGSASSVASSTLQHLSISVSHALAEGRATREQFLVEQFAVLDPVELNAEVTADFYSTLSQEVQDNLDIKVNENGVPYFEVTESVYLPVHSQDILDEYISIADKNYERLHQLSVKYQEMTSVVNQFLLDSSQEDRVAIRSVYENNLRAARQSEGNNYEDIARSINYSPVEEFYTLASEGFLLNGAALSGDELSIGLNYLFGVESDYELTDEVAHIVHQASMEELNAMGQGQVEDLHHALHAINHESLFDSGRFSTLDYDIPEPEGVDTKYMAPTKLNMTLNREVDESGMTIVNINVSGTYDDRVGLGDIIESVAENVWSGEFEDPENNTKYILNTDLSPLGGDLSSLMRGADFVIDFGKCSLELACIKNYDTFAVHADSSMDNLSIIARNPVAVAHEVGHLIGFFHFPNPTDLETVGNVMSYDGHAVTLENIRLLERNIEIMENKK